MELRRNQIRNTTAAYPIASSAKCGGVYAAALSDYYYSAGGYLLSATTKQHQIVDADSLVNLSGGACGQFLGSTAVLVTVAGPVNTVVHYYEQVSATTPVSFLWDGVRNNFEVRATGQKYTVPNAAGMTTSGDDLFLLETFVDAQGRHVYVIYGFSWQGTLAAATAVASFRVHEQPVHLPMERRQLGNQPKQLPGLR